MTAAPTWFIALYLRAARRNRTYATAAGARHELGLAALRGAQPGPPRLGSEVSVTSSVRHGWVVHRISPASGTATGTASGAATGTASGSASGSVVYVHGGGWVHEAATQHWRLAAQLAVDCDTTVDVPLYPLLPAGSAGKVVGVVETLVRENLAELGPTCLAGDSAGGQIALSAALALRDGGILLPLTALIAPALDLSWSNPRIPQVQPTDPWLGVPGGRVLTEAWRGGLDVHDPAVSPLAGDLRGLGPLLVLTGTRDILNPDAGLLRDRAREAGVAVEFREEPGALHVDPLLPTRSGRDARRAIVAAVRRSRLRP